MKKIIKHSLSLLLIGSFLFIAIGSADGESEACKCLDEFNTMRTSSSLYQKCIDKAIIAGQTSDPYGYFERKCNR